MRESPKVVTRSSSLILITVNPRAKEARDTKALLMQIYANECKCPLPIFHPGQKILLILLKMLPASFQENRKSFQVPVTGVLGKTAEHPPMGTQHPALCRCDLVSVPSPGGGQCYYSQSTEAETEIERGHVATPGHSAR